MTGRGCRPRLGARKPSLEGGKQKMSELWTRRGAIGTIFVGLLATASSWGFYFFESRAPEIGTQTVASSDSSEETSSPAISISSIHVSAVAMDIPAVFELGMQVGGRADLEARDIVVVLDFGRAEVEVCDYTPESAVTNFIAEDKSYRRLEIGVLQPQEKLHIPLSNKLSCVRSSDHQRRQPRARQIHRLRAVSGESTI